MGNCCGCLDWGPSLFKKEEEPPAPAPTFRPRTYASDAKTTFTTVSTEQLDFSSSDLTSLLRQDSSDDSNDDRNYNTDVPTINSDDLKQRKANGTLRRRPTGCSLNSSEPNDSDSIDVYLTNDRHDSRRLKSPNANFSDGTGPTALAGPNLETAPGDLNPPSSTTAEDAEAGQHQPHGDRETAGGGGRPASPRWEPAAPGGGGAPASRAARGEDGAGRGDDATAAAVSSAQAADLGFSFRSGAYARSENAARAPARCFCGSVGASQTRTRLGRMALALDSDAWPWH